MIYVFDLLAFTKTQLKPSCSSAGICLDTFRAHERKDRDGDAIINLQTHDLQRRGIEYIWIELPLKTKQILLGLFYRPTSSDELYCSGIEDYFHPETDSDVVTSSDFNFNKR